MYRYYVQRNTEHFTDGRWWVKQEKVSETFDNRWEAECWYDRYASTNSKAHIRYRIVEFWVDPPKPLCRRVESYRHYQAFGGNHGYSETRIYESISEYNKTEEWG